MSTARKYSAAKSAKHSLTLTRTAPDGTVYTVADVNLWHARQVMAWHLTDNEGTTRPVASQAVAILSPTMPVTTPGGYTFTVTA